MRKHKLTIIFAVSTFVLFCILGIILIPKYIEIELTINKTQTLIYLLQLAVGLLLGVGALFLAYKQMVITSKQIDIGIIQAQINQLGLWTTRAENHRAINLNTAAQFKDTKDKEEIGYVKELIASANELTDMASNRDKETRILIKQFNKIIKG